MIFDCPRLDLPRSLSEWRHCRDFDAALSLTMLPVGPSSHAFRNGIVRVGWQDDALAVHASLDDDDVYSLAAADNQETWLLGDVFEIFLRDEDRENYIELHMTPNGFRTQLAFPSPQAITDIRQGKVPLRGFFESRSLFESFVRIRPGGWDVMARVPVSSFHPGVTTLAGRPLRVSFSRYDCTRGKEASMLSSTSEHREVNFHRGNEWKRILCTNG